MKHLVTIVALVCVAVISVAQATPTTLEIKPIEIFENSSVGTVYFSNCALRITPKLDVADPTVLDCLTISIVDGAGNPMDISLPRDKFDAYAYVYSSNPYARHGFGLMARGKDGFDVVMSVFSFNGVGYVSFMRGSENNGYVHEAMSLKISREQSVQLAQYINDKLAKRNLIESVEQKGMELYPPALMTTATLFNSQRMDCLMEVADDDVLSFYGNYATEKVAPLVVEDIQGYFGATDIGKMSLTITPSTDPLTLSLKFRGAIGEADYVFSADKGPVVLCHDGQEDKEFSLNNVSENIWWLSFANPKNADGGLHIAQAAETQAALDARLTQDEKIKYYQVITQKLQLALTDDQYSTIRDYLLRLSEKGYMFKETYKAEAVK